MMFRMNRELQIPPPAGDGLAARIAAVLQQPTADDARTALLALLPEMVPGSIRLAVG